MSRNDSLDLATQLHAAAIRLLRAVRVADDETGLSAPKLSALSVLVFGGPQSLKALARAEQVTAPTMSKLVADLEAAGLAAKRADPADKRGVVIQVTAKGRALMEAGRRRRLALLQERLGRLSKAERDQLAAAAGLMAKLAQP
ncbi:MAG: MarR family transcriptional regulator [Hyphomonadaceae bacterium]|nr:MarR family transcriptional regulator [Hyphomonadaceae bacterium]